jgi:FkbM family methyltransferase
MNDNLTMKACRYGLMLYNRLDIYIGRSLDLYGEYSAGEAALFRAHIRPGMTVLDIGANIGVHTLLFARLAGEAGRVLAFEPQRILFQMLCGNCAINRLENVYAFHGFASDEAVHRPMTDPNYRRAGNFGAYKVEATEGEEAAEKLSWVRGTRIDDLALAACDFVKIDVEGMESRVLEGARDTIRRRRPILYVENDRPELHAPLCALLREELGYRLHWHVSKLYEPQNFFENKVNVFGHTCSVNMLCLPAESTLASELPVVGANWHAELVALKVDG